MGTWFSVSLGDGITSGTVSAEIEEAFASAGREPGAAVFTRPESEGRLHCEIIAYFSPAATEVAVAFEAEPCPPPQRQGLNLLAGHETAWSILFPEGHP